MIRNEFLHDKDNRIQKLYYDVNIHTIFNRTKLQNVKNKFGKYIDYLNKKYYNDIQPKLLELQKIRDELYVEWQRAKRIAFIHNPTHESIKKRQAIVPIFRKADEDYEEMKYEEHFYDEVIYSIQDKLIKIKNQQKKLKQYKKCAHCEKMNMITICGCKSKHKLCYECIYDKTECPVCKEDLGLKHCDICYEYKKEIVDTGCENKHQTCKNCLDKIKQKDNKCPFCREKLVTQFEIGISLVMSQTGCTRNVARNVLNDNNGDVILAIMAINPENEENEDMNRGGMIRGITMHMEDLRETYPSRRYYERDIEEEEEDRREDRREAMRERAREGRANNRR